MGGKSSEQGLGGLMAAFPSSSVILELCPPRPTIAILQMRKLRLSQEPRPQGHPPFLFISGEGRKTPGSAWGKEGTLLKSLGNRLQVEEGADGRGQEGIIT